MQMRKLGRAGLEVSALGLGCMSMSPVYGAAVDDAESIRTLHRSLELGINFWDTAELYGPFTNEELLGRALKGKKRENAVLATKFAFRFNEDGTRALDSSPAHVKRTVEGSLKRLGTDYIDLYYQHRLDPATPIEDTVGALADLVQQGKVRYIGLSEVGPETLRRAHAVHPVSALQSEYSLWERGVEQKVFPTLRELGIGFVAYSPFSRGLLTGAIDRLDQLDASDWRRRNPRFQGDNLTRNLEIVEHVKRIAARHGATPGQVALAWILHQGKDIVPIPGTKRVRYLEENARAADLALPDTAWDELEQALAAHPVSGGRYDDAGMAMIERAP
jgi:aryl-alcohol dehydrogenase-like predicted oxidoreductase